MTILICVLLATAGPLPGAAATGNGPQDPIALQASPIRDSVASTPAPTPNVDGPNVNAAKTSAPNANASNTAPAPRQLRAAVHEAMVQSAKPGPERAAAVRRLAELHAQIAADTQMLDEDRDALARSVRARLKKIEGEITRAARKGSAPGPSLAAAKSGASAAASGGVAPATAPNGPAPTIAAQGGGPQDEGQALVDLIEQTIAPATWDTVGGLGAIRYFGPTHSIVVRQTDDAHEQLRGLIEALGK